MNNSQFYEKIVKVPNKGKQLAKKISLAMSYLLFFSIWLGAAGYNAINDINSIVKYLNEGKGTMSFTFIFIFAAGILTTLMLFLITWKYVQLEYEYSFSCGTVSFAKIYGKKKRKILVESEMKELLIIAPATEEYINKAEHFEIDERVIAVSTEKADNIWLVVTGGKDEKRILVFFEADERSLAVLKSANPFVFVKKY